MQPFQDTEIFRCGKEIDHASRHLRSDLMDAEQLFFAGLGEFVQTGVVVHQHAAHVFSDKAQAQAEENAIQRPAAAGVDGLKQIFR